MKLVSIAGELEVLRRAVESVADLLDVETFGDGPNRRRRARAVVILATERLRLLRRAVIGALDPAELLAAHNQSEGRHPGDDPDLVLVPLSPVPLRSAPRRKGGGRRSFGRRRKEPAR